MELPTIGAAVRTADILRLDAAPLRGSGLRVLLVGPYDPHCGEYTFLAPPLGVWRLKGVLDKAGAIATVFDPNCTDGPVTVAFDAILAAHDWDVVGISTTGMTLRFDLALAHQAKRQCPGTVLVAGGMEATFDPETMFRLAPFDLVVLGEGEKPLLSLLTRMAQRSSMAGESSPDGTTDLCDIPGTARLGPDDAVIREHTSVLDPEEFREAVRATPYSEMPYQRYWARLEEAYRIGALPHKADREARLAEIRSVRLITLNYCPMGCSFCSSTNFLHEAEGGRARIRKLEAEVCVEMIERIVKEQPGVRTIIFQDDIFVFTSDDRILPLCEQILSAKAEGRLPSDLQFISTNRIDAMTEERLRAMRSAGFRVLGFGIESFSEAILAEFNKKRIAPHVEPNLGIAVSLGLTPFLDLILTSPRCSIEDLGETIRGAFRWLEAGCEVGTYPYVIPFSGAALASDPTLEEHTVYVEHAIEGTDITFRQPCKILPVDPTVRRAILEMEGKFRGWMNVLEQHVSHLPSRVRSLVWILTAAQVLPEYGVSTPCRQRVFGALLDRLPTDATLADRLSHHGGLARWTDQRPVADGELEHQMASESPAAKVGSA